MDIMTWMYREVQRTFARDVEAAEAHPAVHIRGALVRLLGDVPAQEPGFVSAATRGSGSGLGGGEATHSARRSCALWYSSARMRSSVSWSTAAIC